MMNMSCWQIAWGGEFGGCRGTEAEDWTAAERQTESPGGQQGSAPAEILQVLYIHISLWGFIDLKVKCT